MGQCWQRPTTQPAMEEGTTMKLENNTNAALDPLFKTKNKQNSN